MPIIDLLERNHKLYGDEVALVEINPELREEQRVTWKEYELIQPTSSAFYRRQITWAVFDEKANRVANMLIERGIRKGQKCAVLLMNCLEWLPIYFGILKAGAVAVPLNFRFTSEEIDYCLKLADADVLFYGPEFIGRIEDIASHLKKKMLLYFVGDSCPSYAEDYYRQASNASSMPPIVLVEDTDDGAIYYSSGTTGFPKAILLKHSALSQSARMEAIHHETTKQDNVFLPCIIQEPRCIGLVPCTPAAAQSSSRAIPPRPSWNPYPQRAAPLYGCSSRGLRISWPLSTAGN